MISIQGVCTRDRALEGQDLLLFTNERRTYAVMNFSDSNDTFGVIAVISDEEYQLTRQIFL